jgi:hypothetical protein
MVLTMAPPDEEVSTPDYVRTLYSGVTVTEDPMMLDTATMKDLARQVREIEEARAAAAVSGRDYLIR